MQNDPESQQEDAASAEPQVRAQKAKRRLLGWPSEGLILTSVFYGLVAATAGVLALDFKTIYEQANVPLPGDSDRQAPLEMRPPKPSDHLRPYLPKSMPTRRSGRLPKMPGYAKPPPYRLVGKSMTFVRGPGGKASAIGRIEPGTAKKFKTFLKSQSGEIKEVHLHSPGGSVRDALSMSNELRKQGIATRVPTNAYCASSCPIVLAGGKVRTAGRRVWIGVHRIYASAKTPGDLARGMAEGQAITATVQKHLVKMGVDPEAWIHAMQTPSAQLYVFTPKELKRYKLATKIRG